MSGERAGSRGVSFPASRDRVTQTRTTGAGFKFCPVTSYGAIAATVAPSVHDKGSTRRRRHRPDGEDPSSLRRCLASVGVLALFAFAVTTANNSRLETGQLRASHEETLLIQVNNGGVRTASLTVTATNEYGEYSDAALALYGLEMVVEPHRATTLTATSSLLVGGGGGGGGGAGVDVDVDAPPTPAPPGSTFFVWRLVECDVDDEGALVEAAGGGVGGGDAAVDLDFEGETGPQVSVELTKPGGVFRLTVEERFESGGGDGDGGDPGGLGAAAVVVVARATVTVSCRYVRRELRELTDADRGDVLDAMQAYYTVSSEEGKTKYGDGFFNYERLTAYHNADLNDFCYHAGLQFLTAHSAFGLMMERSLQAVNPRVSLPFWDYMVEAETLGADWMDSAIFDDDMFGRAMGSAENSYQLTEGRFGNIASILDTDHALVDIDCHRNAFGYLSPSFSYQALPLLTRASSYCNLKAHAVFATSDVFFGCFSDNQTFSEWEFCMERKVHGDIHGLLGGAFDCNVDMQSFHEEHPVFSPALLSFVLEYLTSKYWPGNTFLPESNVCDTECVIGQSEPCGCTCSIDAMSMPEDEVYSMTSDFMSSATQRFAGDEFISFDESSDRPWGFKQDGVRLDDDDTMLLLRHVVKLGCEPSAVGSMVGGISPQDPLFFVLHPIFEKALHVLWMSPKYRDSYSFDWEDGSCSGSKLDDSLPFAERDLGMGTGTNFLTNRDLLSNLHASNPQLPYVYENFAKWGTVDDWDFCPGCTAAAATSAAGA